MKLARDLRIGNVFKYKSSLCIVLKAEFHKSTAGRRASSTEIKMKLQDLEKKNKFELTLEASDKVDHVILDKKAAQFLYKAENYHFIDQSSFEEFELSEEILEDAKYFLKNETDFDLLFYNNMPVGIELPKTMDLKIEYTEPAIKGDTSAKVTKSATLETGLEIRVPLFCEIGNLVRIDTKNMEYMERILNDR